ncbi:MAG: ribonuclease H-like domain-containing protein [Cytophagales bacterium]|nr:ribonuclease H-like domain-containing protein [Cytophagales bacterium]
MNNSLRQFTNILFLDIETVSGVPQYEQLDERLQHLWSKKANQYRKNGPETDAELFRQRGGILAEFGKIVSVALGYLIEKQGRYVLTISSLAADDERALLEKFNDYVRRFDLHINRQNGEHATRRSVQLCAHNGREFDFPYLARRILINRLPLPPVLQTQGKKPWEVTHIDTMDLWKFGDFKNYTSLDLLAAVFNIPSSKEEMDGSLVHTVYYDEHDLEKIARYCALDVVNAAQVWTW